MSQCQGIRGGRGLFQELGWEGFLEEVSLGGCIPATGGRAAWGPHEDSVSSRNGEV